MLLPLSQNAFKLSQADTVNTDVLRAAIETIQAAMSTEFKNGGDPIQAVNSRRSRCAG